MCCIEGGATLAFLVCGGVCAHNGEWSTGCLIETWSSVILAWPHVAEIVRRKILFDIIMAHHGLSPISIWLHIIWHCYLFSCYIAYQIVLHSILYDFIITIAYRLLSFRNYGISCCIEILGIYFYNILYCVAHYIFYDAITQ